MSPDKVIRRLRNLLNSDDQQDLRPCTCVWGREDEEWVRSHDPVASAQIPLRYKDAAVILNGAIKSAAVAIVQPVSAADVSK